MTDEEKQGQIYELCNQPVGDFEQEPPEDEQTDAEEETEDEPTEEEESEEDEPEEDLTPKPEPDKKVKGFGLFKFDTDKKLERRKKPKTDNKPEKEYDVDSLHERWRRWNLIRKEGYVILKTLTRDPAGEYLLETTLVKFEDLPRDAVAVTNEKYTYCLDKIKTSRWYLETHTDPHEDYYESQFNASDAALYMTSNKIDNALAIKWTEYSHIDFKRYMWLGIAALVVIVFLIMRMR